jgi:hypothetical protein
MVARIGNCRIQSRPDRLPRLVKTMRKEVAARGPTIDICTNLNTTPIMSELARAGTPLF